MAHIIYRLHIGGLENGLVNIINRMPDELYRHAIVSLTDYSDFRSRIHRKDVSIFALNKKEGKDPTVYLKLWRLLRRLRPAILHTRNLAALDSVLIGVLAGVPHRIHGEHGRDIMDLHGNSWKYNALRRVCSPFVHRYVPMSHDLAAWLRDTVGIAERKIAHIYNGVDTHRFCPASERRTRLPVSGFCNSDSIVIGNVGRLAHVKDPLTLVHAFLRLLEQLPDGRKTLRLVLVGDGPLQPEIERLLEDANATEIAWLAGPRDDVARLLRGFDVFVLPSLGEGISNTLLEAMATGLPTVSTRVGGTPEIVVDGVTGMMVPAGDPAAMAQAMIAYVHDPALRWCHGRAARERIEREFSIDGMVRRYQALYDTVLRR
ncbi:MAG: TIGR03088 family PEP-CTERM/XrtA system glycosyltransferase [Acidiferrobacterales bacterium]